ncbi:hypothetical protein N9N26_01020 [Candidatus Poseidoniales archaeon]|nr:hypothetical protein [Candidatus Poseidoniales archaeon]
MAKDENVPPVVPHVHTDQTGGAVLPIRGVSNPDSPTARLETTDTGRNEFSYEGPFTPLQIVQSAPSVSLYGYVKAAVKELALNGNYEASEEQIVLAEVETDIIAYRGFLLKSAFTNTDSIWIGNRFTGANLPGQGTAATEGRPKGSIEATNLGRTAVATFDFGADTPMGFALDPGESLFIEINRASNIFLYAKTGQKLYWMAV